MEQTKKRSPLSFVIGAVVLLLVLVGIISIIGGIAGKIDSSVKEQNSQKYSEFEEFIAPIVMYDPDTFDDISMANTEQLISITIWSILDSNIEPDKYEYTDGGMLMPQSEVEEKFQSLFGSQVKWNHCTVDGGGIYFSYSETKEAYVIPITGVTPIYTPKVTEISERPSMVVLTVGYLASSDWVQDSDGNMVSPEPSKYMKITLGKNADDSYYVRAIQSAE
ncbi:MAG: hypothetical protein IJ491_06435 [Clostridia bacterium]|nr:hypothetical protein [Clostridia bacterium]